MDALTNAQQIWQKIFISANELQQQLKQTSNKPLLFDCRFNLFDTQQGATEYAKTHIDGATYLHLDDHMSAPRSKYSGRHPMPSIDAFINASGLTNINPEQTIVVYDQGNYAFAARAWFLCHLAGFHWVKILSGGFAAWQSLSESPYIETVSPVSHAVNDSPLVFRCDLVTPEQVANNDELYWLDAREENRFLGHEEPIDPIAGTIESAKNLPWQAAIDGDGRVKPAAYHLYQWSESSLSHGKPVHFCGSGVTALVNVISELISGREHCYFYPGGWSEYLHRIKK